MKGTLLLCICCAAATMLICTACKQGGSMSAWGSRPVEFPQSWPIPEATAPAGAVQVKQWDAEGPQSAVWATEGHMEGAGEPQERSSWSIAFTYDGPASAVQDHLDQCLKPLGYELMWDDDLPDGRRGYIDASKKHQVWVDFRDLKPHQFSAAPRWQGYRLGISIWKNPRPDITSTTPIP